MEVFGFLFLLMGTVCTVASAALLYKSATEWRLRHHDLHANYVLLRQQRDNLAAMLEECALIAAEEANEVTRQASEDERQWFYEQEQVRWDTAYSIERRIRLLIKSSQQQQQ